MIRIHAPHAFAVALLVGALGAAPGAAPGAASGAASAQAAQATPSAPVPAGGSGAVRATFDRFVAAQNAHDLAALRALLVDSPDFLWITRGAAIWGTEAALRRFATLYEGTWRLAPDTTAFRVVFERPDVAQLYCPVVFTVGAAGQPAPETTFLLNQTLLRQGGTWRVASILPIPLPPSAAPAAPATPAAPAAPATPAAQGSPTPRP